MSLHAAIILAIAVFLCLAVGIIMFVVLYQRRVINHQIQMREFNRQKQMELMQASINSEEEERMRVAAELHDDVGATLSSIRLFLTQAAREPENRAHITQSKDLLDQSIQKIRDLSHQLQPSTLYYLGLSKALQSLGEIITRSESIKVEFVQNTTAWTEPEPQAGLALYRIVQELINNIIKHSGASWIRIIIHGEGNRNCVSIAHDGNGLTETDYQEQLFKKGAIGLKNIENRLKSADLSIAFPPASTDIYTITLCLPPIPAQT